MRPSKPARPLLSFAVAASLALVPCLAQPRQPRQVDRPRGAPTVLFAVSGGVDSAAGSIDPVVVIDGGRYTPPPTDPAFNGDYFRPGREYTVLFGGGRAGSAKVLKYVESAEGCTDPSADAEVRTDLRRGGAFEGLAVSTDRLGANAGARREPNGAERAAAVALARTLYGAKRVRAALVRKMKVEHLTAADLDRDGRYELVGSFRIGAGDDLTHNLFVIFEPAARGRYRPAFTWYHKGAGEDYEDLGLVDVVDIDLDGTAEVVARASQYESYGYSIYRRRRGQWRAVYHGGGGGC